MSIAYRAGRRLAVLVLALLATATITMAAPSKPPAPGPQPAGPPKFVKPPTLEDRARAVLAPLLANDFKGCRAALPNLAAVLRDPGFDRLPLDVRKPILIVFLGCGTDNSNADALLAAGKLEPIAEEPVSKALANYPPMLKQLDAEDYLGAAHRMVLVLDGLPGLVDHWKASWFYPITRAAEPDRSLSLALLSRLIKVEWTDESSIGAAKSYWRVSLAQRQAELKNFVAVRATLKPVTATSLLIGVAQDRRFEPVWAEMQAAGRFDWTAQAEAELVRDRKAAADKPRSLAAVSTLIDDLRVLGRFEEAAAVGQAARARFADPKAFDDFDDSAHWVLNNQGYALFEAGRPAEAEAVFLEAIALGAKHGDTVSQRVNWAEELVSNGRAREAFTVLEGVGRASPVGDRWKEAGRVCALAEYDPARAAPLMTELMKRWEDNPPAVSNALLCLNRLDEAAELMVRRLASPRHREGALAAALITREKPIVTAHARKLSDRRQAVFARPEVIKAIEAVGRRVEVPLYGDYWGRN